jgi:hypothetical protein
MTTISKAIDPKRVGISKSLVTSTALCNRKGWFNEHIRTADGSRLPLIAPERVAFGSALDEAILFIAWHIREGLPWRESDAVAEGLKAALGRKHQPNINWEVFEVQLRNAVAIFRADVLNDTVPDSRPLVDFRGSMLQGLDGESLRVGDLIGTPDFIINGDTRPNGRTLILDLKASSRAKSERDLRSAELSFYAWLWSVHTSGELPDVGYLTFARTAKPRYQLLVGPADVGHLLLADEFVKTTRAVIAAKRQEDVGFSTSFCGSCEWRKPNPEVGFDGCSIGLLVAAEETEVE